MNGSFKIALIAAVVSAFVGAGAAVATTQTFALGATNRVDAATSVTNVRAGGATINPVDAPLVTLDNESTTASATALSLVAAPQHPALKVNTGVKINNLNADALDGRDSGYFLPKSGKAADSDLLDGLNSTAFTQGGGTLYFGHVEGSENGTSGTLFTIPGTVTVRWGCSTGNASIALDYGASTYKVLQVDGGPPQYAGPGITGDGFGGDFGSHSNSVDLLLSRPKPVRLFDPPGTVDDVHVTGAWDTSSSTCSFQAVGESFYG
jgi:hypothetical protein